jgi:hypothetical protein
MESYDEERDGEERGEEDGDDGEGAKGERGEEGDRAEDGDGGGDGEDGEEAKGERQGIISYHIFRGARLNTSSFLLFHQNSCEEYGAKVSPEKQIDSGKTSFLCRAIRHNKTEGNK